MFGEALNEFKVEIRENFKLLTEELQKLRKDFTEEVKVLKDKVEFLTKDNAEKDIVIGNLMQQVNVHDQYSRNKNIEIDNVEQIENEDVEAIVIEIAEKLGLEVKPEEIDAVHRLPSRNVSRKVNKIIVQFTTRKKRDLFLQKRRELLRSCEVTGGNSNNRVYINENLSPFYKELLWRTKQQAKELGHKFVWFKNGHILVRKDENAKQVRKIDTFKHLADFALECKIG